VNPRARKAGYEKSQMITDANGRPIPNYQPIINASAKSKPIPARNSCNDMPPLLHARRARITLRLLSTKAA